MENKSGRSGLIYPFRSAGTDAGRAWRVQGRRGRLPGLVIAFVLFFSAGPAAGQLEWEHELSLEFESAHTKWGKPWAGGAAGVLFFSPWREGRLAVELLQRFDLEAEAVYWDPRGGEWVGGERGVARMAGLLEAERDAYFFNRISPEDLPGDVLEKILAAVTGGRGLVVRDAPGWEELLAEKSAARCGRLPRAPGHRLYRVGPGRVVFIPGEEPLDYDFGWAVAFDHLLEGYGRAILWAADREPEARLAFAIPDYGDPDRPKAFSRADLGRAELRLVWENALAGIEAQAVIRRADGWTRTLWEGECVADGEAVLKPPLLRAGDYYLEARARSAAGVAAWATGRLTVTSPRRVSVLELERNRGEPGAAVTGSIRLSGPPLTEETLQLRILDRAGRVIARQELGIDGDKAAFSFTVEKWMPMLLKVEALLFSGTGEIDAREEYFNVTKRGRGRFHFLAWDYPRGEFGPLGVEALARAGVTGVLAWGAPSRELSAWNLAYIPYTLWLASSFHSLPGSLDRAGVMRKTGCYHDRAGMARYIARIVANHLESRSHGVLAYSLGGEMAVRGSCLGEHCLAAYRAYLSRVYGDIASLNESWGSSYADFETITLTEPDSIPAPDAPEWFREWYGEWEDFLRETYPTRHRPSRLPMDGAAIRAGAVNDELGALQAGNFARWYDRQAFQTYSLVQAVKQFQEAFREIDPEAIAGFHGTDSFAIPRIPTRIRQGGDIDLIVRELGWWGPYRGLSNEVIRSIAPAGFPAYNPIGYFRDARRPRRNYWSVVLDGLNMLLWWRWDGVGRFHGLLAPHYAPYPARREIMEDTRLIRDGLGDWLINAERVDDRIAVLYSLPSTYISHFDGHGSYGTYTGQHRAWVGKLRRLGLEFRYVTDRQLRLGEFDPADFDVFVLPFALALGEAETAVIRDFVRGGGTVIADVRTGTYSGRCRPLEAGSLDDVFGIRREGKSESARAFLELEAEHGGVLFRMAGNDTRLDPAVRLEGGTALGFSGGVPFVVINGYGTGRAFFLNFPFGRDRAPVRPLLRAIFAAAGIERAIGFEDAGEPLVLWRNRANTRLRAVADPLTDRRHLAATFFPQETADEEPPRATAELTTFPTRDWTGYDRLCFSFNTMGVFPEGRGMIMRFYNRGADGGRGSTVARLGGTDSRESYCFDISAMPRDNVRWLRIWTSGDWTGESPFTLHLDNLRLVRSAGAEVTDDPGIDDVDPFLAIASVAAQRTAELKRWRSGRNELISLQPPDSEELQLQVTLPEERHVYCLRTRQALGRTRTFRTALSGHRPNLYALLDSPIPPIRVRLEGEPRRGAPLTVSVSIPGATGAHGVKLTLLEPGGREADWFREVFTAGTEAEEFFIPLAWNDPPGEWTIRATDVFSGETTTAGFTIH